MGIKETKFKTKEEKERIKNGKNIASKLMVAYTIIYCIIITIETMVPTHREGVLKIVDSVGETTSVFNSSEVINALIINELPATILNILLPILSVIIILKIFFIGNKILISNDENTDKVILCTSFMIIVCIIFQAFRDAGDYRYFNGGVFNPNPFIAFVYIREIIVGLITLWINIKIIQKYVEKPANNEEETY